MRPIEIFFKRPLPMAFIASTEQARRLLSAKIGNKELEKVILRERLNSDNSIPTFSHRVTCRNQKFCDYVTKITCAALIDIFRDRKPDLDTINTVLDDYGQGRGRFVKFNLTKLEGYATKFQGTFQKLFSQKVLKCFVVCRKYFDLGGFRMFAEGIVRLHDDFSMLLECVTLRGGILSTDGLGKFIDMKIPKCKCLAQLKDDEKYLPFYKQAVLEQIAFNFDPIGLNRVSLNDLMTSQNFAQLLDIDENDRYENPYSYYYFIDWFGAFTKVVNEDGLCTKAGFKHCKDWNLCDAFVDRVFEVSTLFDGCLDFGSFFHFVVCKENNETPNGARYFFDLFDIDGDGLVGAFDIEYFFKDLVRESGCTGTDLHIFVQEMLDKTQAAHMGFTLEQFTNCGACEEIADILSDFGEFRTYVGHTSNI